MISCVTLSFTSPIVAAFVIVVPPLARLVICLPPALMPLVPSIEIPPTVTLLVVIPVVPIVVLVPIVAASNVTFLAVAILKVLPA